MSGHTNVSECMDVSECNLRFLLSGFFGFLFHV